jgi:hypothetical protein
VKETLFGGRDEAIFPADTKAAVVLEPGDGALDAPAAFVAVQSWTMFGLGAIKPIGAIISTPKS